jgi:hypothetical protein
MWKRWNMTMRWKSYISTKNDKMTTHNKVFWRKEIFELVLGGGSGSLWQEKITTTNTSITTYVTKQNKGLILLSQSNE